LLRDDFLDDSELGDGFDENLVMQPIQLPKSKLGLAKLNNCKGLDICFHFQLLRCKCKGRN
jgi:hypothetical protein